jgi:hypothetical protein
MKSASTVLWNMSARIIILPSSSPTMITVGVYILDLCTHRVGLSPVLRCNEDDNDWHRGPTA